MRTLTDREHRIIADVLVKVAERPSVDAEFMQKVVRYVITAAIDGDPLILYPAWFRDRIIRKLTELPKQSGSHAGARRRESAYKNSNLRLITE